MIAPTTSVADRPHTVTPQHPGPNVPDGDGGYTNSWIDLVPPSWTCEIKPATEKDLERVAAGTVITTNTYIVKGPYRADVNTGSRLLFNGRRFSVTGVANREERNVDLILVCVEVVA